ncbi:ATP-dependent RNA helicase RhlE [uncultured Desulfobacterium sp.]|uniref:DEAD-box ATP-dependent RNA helicase RhpA n=1 Tax=uncultured Desulfobacterium sp. TaxID=201089 RepID=A0A445MQY4_9BACT|nr:ATP-dependent RNA helicase RhlE [uncultured Desulfobacterium sp.]
MASAGFVTPTPIQSEAIPQVMNGRDIMGLAQTGTGKTAAFVLPILHRLMRGKRGHVRSLIMAPTRELAEQIYNTLNNLGKDTPIRIVAVYGGVNISTQIQKLNRGAEIVVACPGRLLDHINRKTIDISQVEVLVIDEADHMFDMGFLPDIRRILKNLPQERQTLLFSATMPKEIYSLAQDILNDPITIKIGSATLAETVSHAHYPVSQHLKTAFLLKLLGHINSRSVLVFTRTKRRARLLGEQLGRAGFSSTSLQGNLSQSRRQAALDGFRNGRFQVLVATDIAARGIDVCEISHVINYDMPDSPDAYIHRIGRTGRAGQNGDAFTLITCEDKQMVNAIDRVVGSRVEHRTLKDFDYSAPVSKKHIRIAHGPRRHGKLELRGFKPATRVA